MNHERYEGVRPAVAKTLVRTLLARRQWSDPARARGRRLQLLDVQRRIFVRLRSIVPRRALGRQTLEKQDLAADEYEQLAQTSATVAQKCWAVQFKV